MGDVEEDRDYREAMAMGLRRAALHWLRAGYEVVAGVGAFLNEVAEMRHRDDEPEDAGNDGEGPVRIELE